jgi:hypothetical protein
MKFINLGLGLSFLVKALTRSIRFPSSVLSMSPPFLHLFLVSCLGLSLVSVVFVSHSHVISPATDRC